MSIDKQALRQKSEAASAGEWIKESGAGWHAVCSSDDQANSGFIVAHFEGPDAQANREFIQAANPVNILALLDELEAKEKRIAQLEEDSAELTRFKEVMIKAAEALKEGKPLNLESLFKGELVSAMFAMMFAGEFKRSGAKNYLELVYDVPDFGLVNVTIQKVDGKTPGQRIAELEESHAQVIHSRDHYKRVADEGIRSLAEARTLTVKLPPKRNVEMMSDLAFNGAVTDCHDALESACAAAGIQLKVEE